MTTYFSSLSHLSYQARALAGKRLFDVCFSSCVLLLGSPAFLLIALLIKLTSKGPIVYTSKRVGRNGKVIHCYKFRSMVIDAQERLERLLLTNPAKQQEWERFRKLKHDPRITSIGHFLRKTSLDELPQFVNVLRGELSVVGPRPVTEEEVHDFYKEHAPIILSMKPGITGLWQVSDRNNCSLQQRAEIERKYVEHYSFWNDCLIALKTVPAMICRRGL